MFEHYYRTSLNYFITLIIVFIMNSLKRLLALSIVYKIIQIFFLQNISLSQLLQTFDPVMFFCPFL